MNSILTQIAGSFENPCEVLKLVAEGKQLVKKRQTLIKIADRNKEGWRLVQEYESDDLTSDSKDEKKLRKAKRAMERKRKEVKGIGGDALEKFKSGSDSQLFRSKIPYCFTLVSRWLDCLSSQPSGCCGYVFPELKGKVIYVCLSVAS